MTISLAVIGAMFGFMVGAAATGSQAVGIVMGVIGLVAWLFLPLPRTNGSMGGETDRYWGFAKNGN